MSSNTTGDKDSSIEVQDLRNEKFAMFVSFVKFQNRYIFDLLVDVPVGKKPQSLKVAQDKHKNYFIRGD